VRLGGEGAQCGGDVGEVVETQDTDGEVAQAGERLRCGTAPDATAILIVGHVAYVVQAVFNAPVAAVEREELLRIGVLGREVGDEIDALGAGSALGDAQDFAFDAGDLLDVGEIEVVV
jgi:hypothetical protein